MRTFWTYFCDISRGISEEVKFRPLRNVEAEIEFLHVSVPRNGYFVFCTAVNAVYFAEQGR